MTAAPFDAADPAAYRVWTEERTRFGDLDAFGHINNNAINIYFEGARVAVCEAAGFRMGGGQGIAAVRLLFEYKAELHHPSTVRIGSRTLHVGRSSFSVAQGLFLGDRLCATSEAVMVMIDLEARGAAPLPAAMRAALEALA
ncbi:MAG TPA: thioesterase family protein [Alphaproteobacteria bacterium]|nr:thioesterase family protein [Alphaproteobacteria bacterium]